MAHPSAPWHRQKWHSTEIPNSEWPWWNPYEAEPLYSSALSVSLSLSPHWNRHTGASSHGNPILGKLKDVYVLALTCALTMFLINTSWMGGREGSSRRRRRLVSWMKSEQLAVQAGCETLSRTNRYISLSDEWEMCVSLHVCMCTRQPGYVATKHNYYCIKVI